MTDQPTTGATVTATTDPLVVITDPEHVHRLHDMLVRLSNGLGRFWRQSMWITIEGEHPLYQEIRRMSLASARAVSIEELFDERRDWTCGTAGCLAGHLVLSEDPVSHVMIGSDGHGYRFLLDGDDVPEDREWGHPAGRSFEERGAELLGIEDYSWAYYSLFSGQNSLLTLWLYAEILTGGRILVPAKVAHAHRVLGAGQFAVARDIARENLNLSRLHS